MTIVFIGVSFFFPSVVLFSLFLFIVLFVLPRIAKRTKMNQTKLKQLIVIYNIYVTVITLSIDLLYKFGLKNTKTIGWTWFTWTNTVCALRMDRIAHFDVISLFQSMILDIMPRHGNASKF